METENEGGRWGDLSSSVEAVPLSPATTISSFFLQDCFFCLSLPIFHHYIIYVSLYFFGGTKGAEGALLPLPFLYPFPYTCFLEHFEILEDTPFPCTSCLFSSLDCTPLGLGSEHLPTTPLLLTSTSLISSLLHYSSLYLSLHWDHVALFSYLPMHMFLYYYHAIFLPLHPVFLLCLSLALFLPLLFPSLSALLSPLCSSHIFPVFCTHCTLSFSLLSSVPFLPSLS